MAPSGNTVTLTHSNATSFEGYDGDFRAYLDIPLVADVVATPIVTPMDTGDETFVGHHREGHSRGREGRGSCRQ